MGDTATTGQEPVNPFERVRKDLEYFRKGNSLLHNGITVAADDKGLLRKLEVKKLREAMRDSGFKGRRLPVRSSYVAALNECPRRFMFECRVGLKPKGTPNRATSIGTMYHWMCEGTFMGMGLNRQKQTVRSESEWGLQYAARKLDEQIKEFESKTDESGLLPDGTPADSVRRDLECNFDIAKVMYTVGFDKFFQSPLLNGWEPVMVEQVVEVKSKQIPAPIRCKPDVIMMRKNPKDGGEDIMIVNHKSTGLKTGLVSAPYPMKIQSRIEALCCEVAFPDQRVTHYLHNLIRRPTLKWPAKKYPEWTDYRKACEDWYAEQAMKDEENPPLLSSFVAVRRPILDEELYMVLYDCAKACRAHLDPSSFYRMPSSCNSYQRLCAYYPLCSTGLGNWADLMTRFYDVNHREDEEDALADQWDAQAQGDDE